MKMPLLAFLCVCEKPECLNKKVLTLGPDVDQFNVTGSRLLHMGEDDILFTNQLAGK